MKPKKPSRLTIDLRLLPSRDSRSYYDPPESSSSSTSSDNEQSYSPHYLQTNSGNKLKLSARFVRKGKMCAWAPMYDEVLTEKRSRKRLKQCLEQFLPDAATEIGVATPQNILDAEDRRTERKRKKLEDKEFLLAHLASPSPPVSTMELAPLLALPTCYLDIMMSPSLRYSLGDDSMDTGLQRTAAELLEGEKGLLRSLGRLREVLRVRERDVPVADKPVESSLTNGNHVQTNGHIEAEAKQVNDMATDLNGSAIADSTRIPALPHISDTDNLWRVTQELLQVQPLPTIAYTITPPDSAAPPTSPDPIPTPVHRLFTCPTGITVNAIPNPSHPGLAYAPTHPQYPKKVSYNLDLSNQCRAVDDALERIAELLADCNEYKERLEEARDRVADVARARKKVWGVVKQRAGRELDRAEGR